MRSPSWPYIAPFGIFLVFMAIGPRLGVGPEIHYPLRVIAASAALILWSRKVVHLRSSRPLASVALGLAVFAVWIGPDLLWPGYRSHWLFQNPLMGQISTSLPEKLRGDVAFLLWRASGLVLLVPIIEELFWRAWMMRYIVSTHFEQVPLGAYAGRAFWITALLFASEHGPFWDVGLAAGVAYNWWMVRTRSLADCILAHAVTNACLAGYVFFCSRWEYLL